MTFQPSPPESPTSYLLAYLNQWGETFYFQRLGRPHPRRPDVHLITHTTRQRAEATAFDTLPEALDVWLKAGRVPGWRTLSLCAGQIVQTIEP